MNLERVAKYAKVSTATVSRVLNNVGPVRESTRLRVLRAAAALRYEPNLHARTLAGGKSTTIGMIVSNLENPFFFDVFQAAETEARRRGFEVVVAHTGYDPARLSAAVRLMLGRRVAGLVIAVSEMEPSLVTELSERRTPAVFFDIDAASKALVNIRVDYEAAMRRVLEHLYGLGHRRFAFIGHHPSLGPTGARAIAFQRAMERYGSAVAWTQAMGNDSLEGGRAAAGSVLDAAFRPTALVCVNDFMALGAMRELHDRGLRIPHDVSVTGFDGIQLGRYCTPCLTSLHIPRSAMGQLASEVVIGALRDGDELGKEFVIAPQLIEGESTAAARMG